MKGFKGNEYCTLLISGPLTFILQSLFRVLTPILGGLVCRKSWKRIHQTWVFWDYWNITWLISKKNVRCFSPNSKLYWPLPSVCLRSPHHPLLPEPSLIPLFPPGISWRAWESLEACSPWSWFSGWPGSTFPRGKASCMGRGGVMKGLGAVWSHPGLVGHAGRSSPTPSKQLVYIMYSLYSLQLGCSLQCMNRIRLLTLTDVVNQSLSFRLDAAQRTIRAIMPRIMCSLSTFSTVFALLFLCGKIFKNIFAHAL